MRMLILIGACIFSACSQGDSDPNRTDLRVIRPTQLRELPGEKSAELEKLPLGTALSDLGGVSRLVSSVYLNDSLFQEPWLQVQTPGRQRGWVYAATVRPSHAGTEQGRQWLLHKRMSAWFGPAMAQRWQRWTSATVPDTDTAFAQVLREGLSLRDTLRLLIARQVNRSSDTTASDFFWLGEMSPVWVVQQMAAGHGYRLFLNFGEIQRMAKHTRGTLDDSFVQVGILSFPTDSIESLFPVWVFPTELETSCSNLGEGHHLNALLAIDQAWRAGGLFHLELLAMKESILSDILNRDRSYWQSRDKILRELDAIQNTPVQCLDARDRLALAARRNMFEAPERNGLKINLRTGI
ncbi:MAG: hypothetical protein IPH12_09185 [Saprospirales bacterium]|nr:hypothetical protein [Saprospirales bacterium]